MTDIPEHPQEPLGLRGDEERAVEVAPHAQPVTSREWLRENLFSSWKNGVVTVVTAAVAGYVGFLLLRWFLVTANWAVVKENLRSYMLARYPQEEVWRVWTALYLAIALAGVSWGVFEKRIAWSVGRAVLAGLLVLGGTGALVYLLDGVRIWFLVGGAVALYGAAVVAGKVAGRRLRRPVWLGWALLYPAILVVLVGFGGPSPRQWGGLVLNVMVATVGIVVSFPVGILLALGRRSSFPAIRGFCVAVIELVRGVPLIVHLLFGVFVLPLLFPPQVNLPTIVRVMIMVILFSSVYVAEIVRGGLQGVHHGQYEAGRAVGLSTWRMTALVILPQALRNTIPAMISHFISLWKDTTLLAIVAGFTELLRSARRAAAGLEFIGLQKEALLGAALVFWAVAISLGRWSQRVEKRVGVGER